MGPFFMYGNLLETGTSGERTPFQFVECDAQGGDLDQIEKADSVLAFILGQLPFLPNNNPNLVIAHTW